MRKKIVFFTALSLMLTGCGQQESAGNTVPEVSTAQETAVPETETEAETEKITEAPAEPETETETEPSTEETEEKTTSAPYVAGAEESERTQKSTEAPAQSPTENQTQAQTQIQTQIQTQPAVQKILRDDIISEYKSAIETKIGAAATLGSSIIVSYTLFDMDYDGIPELIVKYGTCEADFQIAYYTYNSHGLKLISDGNPGGHTSFAYDYNANQIVISQGHMGYGSLSWYDLDSNGNLRFLISAESQYQDADEFTAFMTSYNVAPMGGAEYFNSGSSNLTWVYSYIGDQYSSTEYEGCNYSFLESYQF